MNNNLSKKITDFLEYLKTDKKLTPATITNYGFYLQRFIKFAKNHGINSPQAIDQELITKFKTWLKTITNLNNKTLQPNTQNYHLIALRNFLKYLKYNSLKTLDYNQIKLAKQKSQPKEFITKADLEKILTLPRETKNEKNIQTRDKAILEFFFSTGLRVSELSKLKIKDINFNKHQIIIKTKNQTNRTIALNKNVQNYLNQYLQLRTDNNPHLFIGHDRANKNNNQGLTPRSLERLVQKYAKLAGITQQVTPHTLRQSYAKQLLINRIDIHNVQKKLGHASITTTQKYNHTINQQVKQKNKKHHKKQAKK